MTPEATRLSQRWWGLNTRDEPPDWAQHSTFGKLSDSKKPFVPPANGLLLIYDAQSSFQTVTRLMCCAATSLVTGAICWTKLPGWNMSGVPVQWDMQSILLNRRSKGFYIHCKTLRDSLVKSSWIFLLTGILQDFPVYQKTSGVTCSLVWALLPSLFWEFPANWNVSERQFTVDENMPRVSAYWNMLALSQVLHWSMIGGGRMLRIRPLAPDSGEVPSSTTVKHRRAATKNLNTVPLVL